MKTLILINGEKAEANSVLSHRIQNAIRYESDEFTSISSLLTILKLDSRIFEIFEKRNFVIVARDASEEEKDTVAAFADRFDFELIKVEIC